MGPEILHFNQFPDNVDAAASGTAYGEALIHIINERSKNILSTMSSQRMCLLLFWT